MATASPDGRRLAKEAGNFIVPHVPGRPARPRRTNVMEVKAAHQPSGGQIDVWVLGAFQVAANGDPADGHTGAADVIPAVGGAMGVAVSARQTRVMIEHPTKTGEPKIVARSSCPLTGVAWVNRIHTVLAVIVVTSAGLDLVDLADDVTLAEVKRCTQALLAKPPSGRR